MKTFIIKEEVLSIPYGVNKKYIFLYEKDGFEFGFGRAGVYQGHSHRHFVDLLFAPRGIRGLDGAPLGGTTLVIVSPGVFLPTIEIGDFTFLKFSPDDQAVVLPDKGDVQLSDGRLMTYGQEAELSLSWYPNPMSKRGQVAVSLHNEVLLLRFGSSSSFMISGGI